MRPRRRPLPLPAAATNCDKAIAQRQLDLYALRLELIRDAEQQQAALERCRQHEEQLAARLSDADLALTAAQQAHEAAQREHAAAGLAQTLHAGDSCPVCRQAIRTLPPLETPADLSTAMRARDAATLAQREAR